jgi:1-deoxy-D-xylulose-5-phosphate reductoisomerase
MGGRKLNQKNVVVLGSTGSIGRQALEVIGWFPDRFKLVGLSANRNTGLLEEQIAAYDVPYVAVADLSAAKEFGKDHLCLAGPAGLKALAGLPDADIVLVAVNGIAGLVPTLEAIDKGKTVALANKETLVAGGSLVMESAIRRGVRVMPVDSEHSAIFQCLQTSGGGQISPAGIAEESTGLNGKEREHSSKSVARLILTGSGGPFRGLSAEQLQDVTPEQALKHPTWRMGAKITIDSATLMNKGLEMIEARWLFGVDYQSIEVLIHPQSIVHSLVVYRDGVVMAQLGSPDMRVPIQYALTFPEHVTNCLVPLDLAGIGQLSFAKPDRATFRCLALALEAGMAGGTMTAVLNAANEAAVMAFLQKRIPFPAIAVVVEEVMSRHTISQAPDLDVVLAADSWARQAAEQVLASRW